ncbi:RHS repeat-associated core domain-containing protein [Amycolatopsis australiensis]|uniref:RHS repeat-associated core domain-containing protein n=2 Tax=Amycolatopsis australiensis TaxID=546364 RepID=A0A1K1T6Q0_9PSEU|nr:RHS repeat-associated core domain-containing protein [Amycolatopsis australiensis]
MRRKSLQHCVLRTITVTSAVVLIAAIPAAASAAPETAQKGVPLPASWAPPAKVNRTPIGLLADQIPARSAAPVPKSQSPRVETCAMGGPVGTQSWFPMDRYPISDRMELLVNRADGNAVLTDRELTIKGTGLDMSLDVTYNSEDQWGWDLGGHWTVSAGRGVGLQVMMYEVIVRDATGYCSEYTKNDDGSYTTPSGSHATLTKLNDGSYHLTQDDSGQVQSFTADGQMSSQADRNGHTITYRYNPDRSLASITDTQNRVTTLNRDSNGSLQSVTDPTGQTAAAYSWDSTSKTMTITNRAGDKTIFGLDADNRITTLTTTLGRVYKLTYNDGGGITQVDEPNYDGVASTTKYAYNYDAGTNTHTTTVTDPNSHDTTYTFDGSFRQTKAVDALNHERDQAWSAHGDVASLTDSLNNSVTYDYDPLNNLKGGKLPTGATMSAGYTDTAHPHLPTQIADFSGHTVTSSYDSAGNVTTVHSAALNADVAKYDYTNGLVTKATDGNNHATSYGYDPAGNLTTVTPPLPLKPTVYTYDSLSRVTSVTDGNGVKLVYGYDKLDRVVSVAKADGTGLAAYTYDKTGNRTIAQYAGATLTNSYERRLLTRVVRTAATTTGTATYHYDRAGNLTAIDDPTGWIYYGYDAANRLTSVKDQTTKTTTYGYDDADHRTSATLPGGSTETIALDKSGRQTGITVKNPAGTTLLSTTYRYTRPDGTDTGQLQSRTDATGTADNTYDGFGRLTKAGSRTYSYDNAGNITAGDGHTYTVNDANQMTSIGNTTVGYDGAGNLTTTNPGGTAHYSDTNQLTSITTSTGTAFTGNYDTLDQTQPATITEQTGSSSTTHVFTRTALGISRTVDNGATTTYAHDTGSALTGLVDNAGKHHNAITDYQGSVLALVDDTGAVTATYGYTPYGFNTSITGPAGSANRLRWLGSYQLASSEYLTGYRHYNPAYNRFTQPDTTGQEDNAYAYGQGDPVNRSDANGDYSLDDFIGDLDTIGKVTAGAAGIGAAGGLVACVVGPVGCAAGAGTGSVVVGAIGAVVGIGIVAYKRIPLLHNPCPNCRK